jgi:hypothetical protein
MLRLAARAAQCLALRPAPPLPGFATGVEVEHTKVVAVPGRGHVALGTGQHTNIPAQLVLVSIGYRSASCWPAAGAACVCVLCSTGPCSWPPPLPRPPLQDLHAGALSSRCWQLLVRPPRPSAGPSRWRAWRLTHSAASSPMWQARC